MPVYIASTVPLVNFLTLLEGHVCMYVKVMSACIHVRARVNTHMGCYPGFSELCEVKNVNMLRKTKVWRKINGGGVPISIKSQRGIIELCKK